MLLAVVTLFAALSVPQTALGGPSLLDTAEVSGNIAGAAALGFDSGAAGLARETELYIGQRRSLSLGGPEYLRLSTVLPVGSVSLLVGYERFSFVESDSEQTGHQEILTPSKGKVQTPALGVLHEIGHALHHQANPKQFISDATTPAAGGYHNLEEKKTIDNIETPAAKKLGEPTRAHHGGIPVTVKCETCDK